VAITLEDLAARLEKVEREKAQAEQKAAALEEEMRALRAALETPARGHRGAARKRGQDADLPPAPAGADQAGPVRTNRRRVLRTLLGVAVATVGAGAALEAETGRAAADGQPLETPDTPGTFSSNTSSVPAVTATGTNGASGIRVVVAAAATGVSVVSNRGHGVDVTSSGRGVDVTSSSDVAVYAVSSATQEPTVWAKNTGGGTAIIAQTSSAANTPAVQAFNNGSGGDGVLAVSQGGTGVVGDSSALYGGAFSGALAPIWLRPSAAGIPTTGSHRGGELYVDSTNVLWYCIATGTPGTWKRVVLQ
jgi:hypothetical protein